ncbi:two-component sensor histidine kinase [Lysobacter xinjiangensis]|uniref:Two-component sensor histidine kinase n=1 Tax=Cognatilysobacter xinjiangensis TaxID=546892 RepID=A0ABQ3C550_9GAMM|nr:sensor histidine kinase [Lysobacter xinjiangensis]GGZ65838.1 two-component sensor histidine kinase [Lysobacter xinjiangensis]
MRSTPAPRQPIFQLQQPGTGWMAWLNIVWSIWIFLVPLMNPGAFPGWLLPTLASYALFLLMFQRVHYGDRRWIPWLALGMGALGFTLTPLNPGAQGYVIYACAYLPFCLAPRRAIPAMVLVLGLYTSYWLMLGLPWLFVLNAIVVGLVVGLMNVHYSRRKQVDAALKLSHDEVRRLAALAERERIGRDLHDLLGHTLSLVAIKSELAGKLVERDPAAARRELDEVSRVAREALTQVRSAVTGIRAAGLGAELASARLLLEADAVELQYALAPVRLPPEIETVLALTVREAVTNIQRHARARHAEVTLSSTPREVKLCISDDGRGGAIAPGNGLSGMRERIEALGGRLRIESAPGSTRLEACIPLPRAAGHVPEDDLGAAAA